MKAIVIITLLLSYSCSSQWDYARILIQRIEQGVYVRDIDSGLCYLLTDAHAGVNATCVPCDSLREVKVLPVQVAGVGGKHL